MFVQGVGWTQATAGVAWAAFFTLFGLFIRQVGPWRKQSIDAQQKLRDDLIKRVEKLEDTLDRERHIHNAERALDRHKLNNITQCFDAIILMLEAAPEKVTEIVSRIKEMRSEQQKAEALEKAAIHRAKIQSGEEIDP